MPDRWFVEKMFYFKVLSRFGARVQVRGFEKLQGLDSKKCEILYFFEPDFLLLQFITFSGFHLKTIFLIYHHLYILRLTLPVYNFGFQRKSD